MSKSILWTTVIFLFSLSTAFTFKSNFLPNVKVHSNTLQMSKKHLSQNDVPVFTNVWEALLTYEELHATLEVPIDFIVPKDAKWSVDFADMQLGRIVDEIREKRIFVENKQDLLDIGFNFEKPDDWRLVRSALLSYKNIFGNIQIPSKYKVPIKDARWEDKLLGFNLGKVVSDIRNNGKYSKYHDELVAMGFDMKEKK